MFDSVSDNPAATVDARRDANINLPVAIGVAVAVFFAFYFSTSGRHNVFDYTYRVASAFLHGNLGLTETPPSWLNEFVPAGGKYYSVFPLGAYLVLLPVALLKQWHLIDPFPGRVVAALLAAACAFFFFGLSSIGNSSLVRRVMLTLVPIFGTWTWCNLGFGGAWQIALGFALLGEVAALYFTLVKPRPFLAGVFFALAIGNRTELILTAPIFLYLWFARDAGNERVSLSAITEWLRAKWRTLAVFLAIPAALALCTGLYNYARFGSMTDFGYARIPRLLNEPWYQHGLFSLHAIPWNLHEMLFKGMENIYVFPFIRPYPFGCSIFLASPFLFFLFREGGKYKAISWIAIGVLTFALWCHGNPGGWQFSYRYGMILLPWMFLLLLGNGPLKASTNEGVLLAVSIAINGIATYQFHWTDQIHP